MLHSCNVSFLGMRRYQILWGKVVILLNDSSTTHFIFLALAESFPFSEVELYVELKSMVKSNINGTSRYGAYMDTSRWRSFEVWGPGKGFMGNGWKRM